MSILIATPMRGAAANFDYTLGLMQSSGLFGGWMPMTGQSDVYLARCTLANEFMKTDHDSLIFIDSDIGFSRQNLIDLVATPEPFVSGLYPGRCAEPEWIFRGMDREKVKWDEVPADGLLKAAFLGCGFLKIDRIVFETLIAKKMVAPYGCNYQYFRGEVVDGHLLSEDYTFSWLVSQAGFQPYINCAIDVAHDGRKLR